MRRSKPSAEEIAKDLMSGNPPNKPEPAEFLNGRRITGDFFYSTVQGRIKSMCGKKYPYELFSEVCNILRSEGYWVHS